MKDTSTRKWTWFIYVAYFVLCVLLFYKAEKIFERSNSCDLLYRVVGSRLMEAEKPAYFYKWKPGESYRYFHFRQREKQPLNGVTVTPAVLRLNMIFTGDDFCLSARQWFYIQCGILFLTGLLLLIAVPGIVPKVIALFSFIIFFGLSRNFYAHIHVAQVYVLYELIFCLYYLLLKSEHRYKYFWLGVLTIVAGWLRPIFFVLCIPLLFREKRKKILLGSFVGVAMLLLQVMFSGDLKYWKEYSAAMSEYAKEIPGTIKNIEPSLPYYVPAGSIECTYPAKSFDRYGSDGLQSVQYYLHNKGISIDKIWLFALATFILVVFLSFIGIVKRKLSAEQLAVLLFLCYLFTELLTPANRFPYNLIEWALPVIVILSRYKKNVAASLIMLAGVVLNHFPFDLFYIEQVGELMMIIAAVYFVFRRNSDAAVLSPVSDQ